jgi:hypothetical protein
MKASVIATTETRKRTVTTVRSAAETPSDRSRTLVWQDDFDKLCGVDPAVFPSLLDDLTGTAATLRSRHTRDMYYYLHIMLCSGSAHPGTNMETT